MTHSTCRRHRYYNFAVSVDKLVTLALACKLEETVDAVDAMPGLVPALQGFSPTPEFPEIEQA